MNTSHTKPQIKTMNSITTPRQTTNRLIDIIENIKLTDWHSLCSYSRVGSGAGAFYKNILRWEKDSSGIYFIRAKNVRNFQKQTLIKLNQNLFYIGRSGQIARRLNRHLKVIKHDSASLVYKITSEGLNKCDSKRQDNMSNCTFKTQFCSNQAYIRDHCEMSYYLCENNEEQALLEILFWLRFKTQFNDWKTH
jgi:hypothetical protein